MVVLEMVEGLTQSMKMRLEIIQIGKSYKIKLQNDF